MNAAKLPPAFTRKASHRLSDLQLAKTERSNSSRWRSFMRATGKLNKRYVLANNGLLQIVKPQQ
jgi:hypothetical protein